MREGNVLTEITWIVTTEGEMTVENALLRSKEINLAYNDVPAFIYGSQLRFLMTIVPLLCMSGKPDFAPESIRSALSALDKCSDLFHPTNPFLQIPHKGGEKLAVPQKLYASNRSKQQDEFWSYENDIQESMPLSEAVRALVSAYFYMPGTNTKLLERKLSNGSSALRYKDSTEIIAEGKSLQDVLLFNTPKSFLERSATDELLPHWADRECKHSKSAKERVGTPLWEFSWSSNTFYCEWEDNANLLGIVRGGVPGKWDLMIPRGAEDKWGKEFHDNRSARDPLFFYTLDGKTNEQKMRRLNLSGDPYHTVAQWNAEGLSGILSEKWNNMLMSPGENLENALFLEHTTEGTAQSFSIRHSQIIRGWRDELFLNPENEGDMELVAEYCKDLLIMQQKVRGFFTKNGTCNHIENRQGDMLMAYWREMKPVIEAITLGDILQEKEAQKRIVKGAVRAFESVSDSRNTLHIKNHLRAIRMINNAFYTKGENKK